MNIISTKYSKITFISLIVTLALITCVLLFLALVVEKRNISVASEINNQRIIFSISEEKIISRNHSLDIKDNLEEKLEDNNAPDDVDELISKNKQIIDEDKRPAIAIIIGGVGLSESATTRANKLPSSVTLGFSPYGANIDSLSYDALSRGHELLINLPLEPIDYPADDFGPLSLLSELPEEENIKRLKFILSRIKDIQGVYTVEIEKFTRSLSGTQALLATIANENKIFIYGYGKRNIALRQIAERVGYSLLTNNIAIDSNISSDAIHDKLQQLEDIAHDEGIALGFGNAYPITTDILEEWISTLDNKGLRLVPISTYKELFDIKKFKINNNKDE